MLRGMSESLQPVSAVPSLFPLFADLRGRAVLVVGGGAVAHRKVEALLKAGAKVTVCAPMLEPALECLAAAGRIECRCGAFEPGWLEGAWLAVAASNDLDANQAVAEAAQARRVFVNVVDDARASSFHVPARLQRGRMQIAISTGGAAPVLARRLREKLEAELDASLTDLVELFARERLRIRRRFPFSGGRRRFFDRLLDGELPRLLRMGDAGTARAVYERALRFGNCSTRSGSVALVGAGPGDPGLLTLKALRMLNDADVILHDRLIGAGVLELARRDAECVDVGKRVGEDHVATQARIHALMLEHARAGRRVVRLKGGDPLLFARGGEEIEFLRVHGIPCQVIPGISAAFACAAAAQVPLTHRKLAQSVTFVTGRCKDSESAHDWRALVASRQTLAVYMGIGEVETLTRALLTHGCRADTPFALVENGSCAEQRVITGCLADLAERAAFHAVRSPALLILGEVAALAPSLAWFGEPPLGATVHDIRTPQAENPAAPDVLTAVHRA